MLHTSRGALLLVCTIARTCTRFSKRQHDAVVYRGKLCVAERSSSSFFPFFFFCFLFLFRENRGSGSRTVNFQTLVISATEMKGQGKKKKQKCVFRLNLKTFDDECSKTVFETSNLFSVSLFIQTPGASRTTFARCQFEAFEALTNFIVYQISK